MDAIFMLVGGLVSIGFGWVLAIDQDRAWEWHRASARRKGFADDQLDRTSEWETDMGIRGFIFMAMGVLCVMVALCTA